MSTPEPPLPNPKIDREVVAAYYEIAGPLLLPFVKRRPLNLLRCQGRYCWFQRNEDHPAAPAGTFGAAIGRVPVAQKNGRTEDYLYVEDIDGISQCVAARSVEFHGWGSLVADVEKPDRLVIDLDPSEELAFEAVREAALEVREAFAVFGLQSFAMLSGGKGVHIVLPIAPEHDWALVRGFARQFCATLVEARPSRYTIALPKAQRRGRIFLDFLRNQRTATAIMPYSMRARPSAPVAAPVTWRELPKIDSAARFTVADTAELVRRARGKPLRGWGKAEQRLPI